MFPPEKLLIIDRYVNLGGDYSHVTQEFEQTTFHKLSELFPRIKKYKKAVLFFKEDADYPVGIKKGFQKFVQTHQLKGEIIPAYQAGTLQKETLYIFISANNLFKLVKDCKIKGFQIGQEIGIVSHNDNIVKEIISDGITTISIDFKEMAELAASFVNGTSPIRMTLPSTLLDRNSV